MHGRGIGGCTEVSPAIKAMGTKQALVCADGLFWYDDAPLRFAMSPVDMHCRVLLASVTIRLPSLRTGFLVTDLPQRLHYTDY